MAHICIARVDRIGDLILTLPTEAFWKAKRPEDKITWLVNENWRFIMNARASESETLFVTPPKSLGAKIKVVKNLTRELHERKIDVIISIHAPWWIGLAIFLSKIPVRVAAASQWFSFIFFNKRLRQKRSQALRHESQYNLDLVAYAVNAAGGAKVTQATQLLPARLVASGDEVNKWSQTLKENGADLNRLVIIHGGMAGSARNWPPHYYGELAKKLIEEKVSVVITGSSGDKEFLEKTGLIGMPGTFDITEQTPGSEILAVLSLAKAMVAPSTGVAHMAASLGVPVAGIYSPVAVQAPVRWAPLGPEVRVFEPQVHCPGHFKCLGKRCKSYDCMEEIAVDSIFSYVMDKL